MKKTARQGKTIKLAWSFLLVVFILVFLSLAFKGLRVYQRSLFKSQEQFTVVFLNEERRGEAVIVSLSQDKKATIVDLRGTPEKEIENVLGVPLDGKSGTSKNILSSRTPSDFFSDILLNYGKVKTNLTLYDAFRLYLLSRGIKGLDVESVVLQGDMSQEEIDKEIENLLVDNKLKNEGLTIEIINGANVPGLGAKIARRVENIGGNVASLRNSQDEFKNSSIVYSENTYTIERLSGLFKIMTIEKEDIDSLSDVVVRIGVDKKDL